MGESRSFYEQLAPMRSADEIFDERHFVPAPLDWLAAFSDIRGSTGLVAAGRHSDVNFAAASMIAALTNLCGPIPFQFGGDGAVALVPPEHGNAARCVLARTRGFAARDFGLDLRVGIASLADLADAGATILVGRYEPSPGAAYAVFRGGGIALFEQAVKGRGAEALARRAVVADDEDDGAPPDLTGLSCRWTPVRSARGRMITLVLRGQDHATLHAEIARIVGVPRLNAIAAGALKARWPPKGLLREAHARRGRAPLALMAAAVTVETLFAFLVLRFRLRLGSFDTGRYLREVEEGAVNFERSDDTLCMVFDCPGDRLEPLAAFLDDRARAGALRYGMHQSDHAVMTCLVTSVNDGRHVHFVDGGDGGYTSAAAQLKGLSA